MPTALPSTSSPPPPNTLLQYLSPYRVIVCTSCKYAIRPKAIARHLKEIHRMKRSDRDPFMQHVAGFELADQELVMDYEPSEFPVPLLPIQNGLQCRSEDCTYLCATEKRMRHHWLSVHGRQGLDSRDWKTAPIQTFFMGNLLRYFTGTPLEKPAEITAPLAHQNGIDKWTEQLPDPSFLLLPTPTTNSSTLNESDRLLMQHFTTHTWLALADNESMRQMWRVTVLQLAYQHDYLMHAILACAALHMAHLYPDRRSKLVIQARTHQDHAIPAFFAAVPSVESETCDAVLIFVRLVSIVAFSLEENSSRDSDTEDKLPSWLFFIRSGCTMFCDVWDRMGTGPVRYLTESWGLLVEKSQTPHQLLFNYFLAIPAGDWPEAVRLAYNESALVLAHNFSCLPLLDEKITTLDVIRFWPIRNSMEFVDLFDTWHPGALILLAHYCILMHRVGAEIWYLKGAAAGMLSTIARRLDVNWHRYIEWPLNEVGLPPTIQKVPDDLPIVGSLALCQC
ncbi:hypothetical protein N431DRAFT_497199 [Stipitochalara longipes BDJ]|nr:hypothetical protein N431DRAFT_497199 [Stipitochalara longipes BDJ]